MEGTICYQSDGENVNKFYHSRFIISPEMFLISIKNFIQKINKISSNGFNAYKKKPYTEICNLFINKNKTYPSDAHFLPPQFNELKLTLTSTSFHFLTRNQKFCSTSHYLIQFSSFFVLLLLCYNLRRASALHISHSLTLQYYLQFILNSTSYFI